MEDLKEELEECRKRKKEYLRMIDHMEELKLALHRSVGIENLNIEALKKQMKAQKKG